MVYFRQKAREYIREEVTAVKAPPSIFISKVPPPPRKAAE
jgi:hypothetical protein